MPRKKSPISPLATEPLASVADQVQTILQSLETASTDKDRANLKRFAITTDKFFGVSMANLKPMAKRLGRHHELAAALWETGWYEARMLATLIDEPARVTPVQMDRWSKDFDNWAICDTACVHLFDRTPHAFKKVLQWSDHRQEFVKRAAFALLASVAVHDKKAEDEPFVECLPLIERAADDERNFVKKGVSWALRAIGGRNPALHSIAMALAERLVESSEPAARWVGRDAVKDLSTAAMAKRVARGK